MTSSARSVLYTRGLYAGTVVLALVGLVLQLVPSTRRLEASSTNASGSPVAPRDSGGGGEMENLGARQLSNPQPRDSASATPDSSPTESETPGDISTGGARPAARDVLLGEYQAVVIANIFGPERAPPRARYRPRGTGAGQADEAPPAPVRRAAPRARLFGVTLRATGAVALIDANPAIPGAEIYRVGDSVAGGTLVEIGPASVVIARGGVRQVIPLEREPSMRDRSRAPADSLRAPSDSVRAPADSVREEQ